MLILCQGRRLMWRVVSDNMSGNSFKGFAVDIEAVKQTISRSI